MGNDNIECEIKSLEMFKSLESGLSLDTKNIEGAVGGKAKVSMPLPP